MQIGKPPNPARIRLKKWLSHKNEKVTVPSTPTEKVDVPKKVVSK
jgi:hypothetical protein